MCHREPCKVEGEEGEERCSQETNGQCFRCVQTVTYKHSVSLDCIETGTLQGRNKQPVSPFHTNKSVIHITTKDKRAGESADCGNNLCTYVTRSNEIRNVSPNPVLSWPESTTRMVPESTTYLQYSPSYNNIRRGHYPMFPKSHSEQTHFEHRSMSPVNAASIAFWRSVSVTRQVS